MAGKKGMSPRALLNGKRTAAMWNSMRQLRTFTTADIVATAEVTTSNAAHYLRGLLAAEYLVMRQPARRGVPGSYAVYALVRNTGPVAPRVTAEGVFDGNLADPYQLPPNKRICKHANAILKALRELVDAIQQPGSAAVDQAVTGANEVLAVVDGKEAA